MTVRESPSDRQKPDPKSGCLGILAGTIATVAAVVFALAGCASSHPQTQAAPPPSAPVVRTSVSPSAICDSSCRKQEKRKLARDRRREARLLRIEQLTEPQQNARESAQQYLSFQAFSRLGLIGQLSSHYGDGYSLHDATVAVNSLSVNWKSEAVKSAKQYLRDEPFSCSGLTQQLDSAYGEKFTVAQATYGASKSGAC